jgi:aryl-alcohol dehydrogenase-like predicted oxidoreductase
VLAVLDEVASATVATPT